MKELTVREKIGQMLIIRIFGNELTKDTIEMIKEYKIGGVILYRKNYSSYDEMLHTINELTKINKENGNVPLFISIDQEGGRVNRMPYELKNIKSAGKLAVTGDLKLIREAGKTTSQMLKKSGFNMNFAPVLDIQRFENGHAIGDRCFGKNAEEVTKNGLLIIEELSKGEVIPVVKHFPGHGATNRDSHFFLPVIKKSMKELEDEDIIPFKASIEQGAEVVMVGHLMIKDIDKINPASLSKKVIQGYLRDKYNFKGLIMTDDLKMRAISLRYGYVRASFRACKAGNDIIMIGTSYQTIKKVIKKLEKKVKQNKLDINQINQSVEKIINIKKKYKILDETALGCNIEEINNQIEKINNKIEQA